MTRQKDIKNNWVTLMFPTKCRYNYFLKQLHIDTCIAAFKELEELGFKFGVIGFGGNHVHFEIDVPKEYSIEEHHYIKVIDDCQQKLVAFTDEQEYVNV